MKRRLTTLIFSYFILGFAYAQTPSVQFAVRSVSVAENAATVAINVTLTNPNGQPTKVDIVPQNGTAILSLDLQNAATNELTFTGDTTAAARTLIFNVLRINNDVSQESDEYFTLSLRNPTNGTVGRDSQAVVFIQDDDRPTPVRTNELELKFLNSYKNAPAAGANSAEIVAFDKGSKRLFIANSLANRLDIVDFSDPSVPRAVRSVDIKPIGGINSVAIQDGLIVACFEDSTVVGNGRVAFFDTAGTVLKTFTVGVLPDHIGFSPDGKTVATANEAQPANNYTADPEGSVTLIDLSKGLAATTQTDVTTIGFQSLNPLKMQYRNIGIRIFGGGLAVDTVTVAQDFEPEFIAFSPDSRFAYVTLQENNAVLVIDVVQKVLASRGSLPAVFPLGMKDMSIASNGFDASDQAPSVNLVNWRVKAAYAPDAITQFSVRGRSYLATANEGDFREYGTISEEATVASLRLDPAKFPDSTILKRTDALGRLVVSKFTGDTDRDGDTDELHLVGARSFSIWDARDGSLVWDSGDLLERITRDSVYFNANNSSATMTRKNRSDNKGPEPEGITTAIINGKTYAFVSLERTGGVAIFNVTNPENPTFTTYAKSRKGVATDDLGPEGILYINANESPSRKNLLLLANEISSTISVFEVAANTTPTAEVIDKQRFTLYPNPSVSDHVFFSRMLSGSLVNSNGQVVRTFREAQTLDVGQLASGVYFVAANGFEVQKLVVKR
jgi:DNA-binding beta-propeller fold protein YncE